METARQISAAAPLCSGPRLWQLELEPGEESRRLRDVRRSLRALRTIRRSVCVAAHCPGPSVHQFTLGHEFVHLCKCDFEWSIDLAELFKQLVALVVIAEIKERQSFVNLFLQVWRRLTKQE